MKRLRKTTYAILIALSASLAGWPQEKIIVLNEGIWQADNGRISYFEDGKVISNQWFRDVNGRKLGDSPSDIVQISDNLLAIAVNWSNIVQFINSECRAVGQSDEIPNVRKLAADGQFVYATSYGHECYTAAGIKTFSKGFVAKIDCSSFRVIDAVEVGFEPEGIAVYNGFLFVANSGGYAFQEDHDYETTISVLKASSMEVITTIDTGQPNLYGTIAQSDKYLCISSPGDYYSVDAATIILDCEKILNGAEGADCFVRLNIPSTAVCSNHEGGFYSIGYQYSYYTGDYELSYYTLNPTEIFETNGINGVTSELPGNMASYIEQMSTPYSIYLNPYTGFLYATDASSYASAGYLYQWSKEGEYIGKWGVYINPGSILALPPDGIFNGVENVSIDYEENNRIFDLQGREISAPKSGQIYISKGKKFIQF